jgi:uncharacterized membrane-anchored protein YitT (DUF2179 family)
VLNQLPTEMQATAHDNHLKHKGITKKSLIQRAIFLTMGAILVSVSLEIFLIPNQIIDGGVVGISIILSYLFDIPIGILLIALNLPFLYMGYKQIGRTFTLSTFFAVILLAIGTTVLHQVDPFTENLLLAAVFGGIILGVGVGMVIRFGGSLDGTEIVAIVFNKRFSLSVGEVVMFLNLFILGSAGFVFGWDQAMYSLISYFIAFKMIDVTIEGFDESKSVWIISDLHKEIGETIMDRLGRGVTYLHGEGGFSGGDKKVIFCVVTRLEEAKLKVIVEEIDVQAFMAIGHIHDVRGGRFKKRDIH